MKVYISGKITGLDLDLAKKKFEDDELLFRDQGHDVVNPMKLTGSDGETWRECMMDCIEELFYCDAIYMQPDWGMSRGARVEYALARELELKVIYGSKMNVG